MNEHSTLRACALALLAAGLLSACDQLGIEDPAKIQAAKEAEGKAIGSACRQAARAIEDCYTLNPKALKAAIFAGWREMDEYMRENKLEPVIPVIPRPSPAASKPRNGEEEDKPADAAEKAAKSEKSEKSDKADEKPAKGAKAKAGSH
jgi:hypothetical protein